MMCDLCNIVESAKQGPNEEKGIHYSDSLCVIVDSKGDKPKKDGFQPKVVVDHFHEIDPVPTTKDYIIQIAKRLFRDRKLWFPSTDDTTENGKRLP
jgi:hypothetical protein